MRLYFLILLFIISLPSLGQKYSGDSWASVKAKGNGTLAVVYYEQAGLIEDKNGKQVGLAVDLLNDFVAFIDKRYGKKVAVVYKGKESVFGAFMKTIENSDNVLGVTNVTITESRKKTYKFTPPFITNPIVLITHKDAPELKNISEIQVKLAGYTAEIISGSTHVDIINEIKKDYNPSLSISYGTSGQEIAKKIVNNPKIFTLNDLTEFLDAKHNMLPLKKQSFAIGKPEELAFVMPKQSDWDLVWKEFLTDDYKKSTSYRKYIANHLGSAFLSFL